MDQQASNANMPRDAADINSTLKQIQKQGLSISIVKSNASFSSSSPVPAEIRPKQNMLPVEIRPKQNVLPVEIRPKQNMLPVERPKQNMQPVEIRPKQNVLPVEKVAKPMPVTSRSQTTSDSKAQIIQARASNNSEARVTPGRIQTQNVYHETKATMNQIRPALLAASESKVLSPPWTGQISSAEKPQGATSRPVVTTPVSKMQTIQSRSLMAENKTPGCRGNQSILPENKTQARVMSSGQRVSQNQHLVEDMSAAEASISNPGIPVTARMATAKRAAAFNSPAKKKCVKKVAVTPAEMSSKSLDGSNLNSPDEGNENGAQLFNNFQKASRAGLTITPVQSFVSSSSSMPPSTAIPVSVVKMPSNQFDKEAYRIALEKSQLSKSPRGKSRSRGRRKYVEPVCLTLSSDDEEEHMQAQFNNFEEAFAHEPQMFRQESEEEGKSGQSSPAYQDENDPGCEEDPEFPGVTDIPCPRTPDDTFPGSEEEEEEGMEEEEDGEMDEMEEEGGMLEDEEAETSEMDEEEEVPPEEEDEPSLHKGHLENICKVEQPLRCRSVRIGSFKVHPKPANTSLSVYLASDGISFNAPMVTDSNRIINITVKPPDIVQLLVHFGKCLPIIFVITTPNYAENIRKSLNMLDPKAGFYDPTAKDDKIKKITFLIDSINEEQRKFFRHHFISDKKVKELDQKTANEILVTSTPSQHQIVRCEVVMPPAPTQHLPVTPENLISVTPVQTQIITRQVFTEPVTRLLTYPPPPQTGGIPITNEDLACLNEGEFLNDVIIDFYLKYIYNEKLSAYHREKTHIFSSYFFPRLSYKPERPRAVDEVQKNVQIRRHSQVKTWTRHVDIFSKDFIIIPVNQNVHWFLAIVCYPGLVPEASESPVKPDSKTNKLNDNVSSTDDQDENKTIKEANSTVDGNNHNSDENSQASNSSMFENEETECEEPVPEGADSSTHPERRRKKEVPCICIFDSLNGPNRSRIVTMLREYLEVEWKMRKGTRKVFDKTTMQGYIMQCPQQNNYSDCGVYVLQYVESFFENPIPYFDSPIPNLSNWFTKETVAKKRQELKDLILNLQKKYNAASNTRNTSVTENVPSTQAQVLQTDNR